MNKRPDDDSCVFDPIIAGRSDAHLVLDEPDVVAFLDNRPLFPGHTLVVPRAHHRTVADLPAGMAGALWDAGARVAAAQRRALGAEGTFFGLNDVVSQSVPHVHLHVVPRRPRDGLKGFFWPRSRYPDDAAAAGTAAALRRALEEAAPAGDADQARPDQARPDQAQPHRARPAGTHAPGGVDPGPLRIRPAVGADAGAIAAILAAGSLRSAEDPSGLAAYRAALDEIEADPLSRVLVAELAGSVVGACQLIMFRHLQERGGLCAEIESMHVASGHRSAGIGAALLEAAVEAARSAGCYRIQLTSNKARGDAHRFYARHGFEASHEGFKLYLSR